MFLFSPITEKFTRDAKYPWYEGFNEERISFVDDDKNIVVHDSCINLSQEDNSQYIPFEMERYYQGIDLTKMMLQIYFVNSDQKANADTPINVEYSDYRIRFGWLVDKNATYISGNLLFEIRAIGTINDEDGNEYDYVWKTRSNSQINIEKSLHGHEIFTPDINWYTTLVKVINEKSESAENSVNATLSSEQNAKTSENNAAISESNAKTSESNAATSEANAKASETNAGISAADSAASATLAKSWAVGGTGVRADEATNNAKYWCELTEDKFSDFNEDFRVLNENLNSEITRAKSEESTLSNTINTEITRAKSAEDTLRSSINTTNTNLSAEITRAQSAESVLDTKISTGLDLKANSADVNAALSAKADVTALNSAITNINTSLSNKADISSVNAVSTSVDTLNTSVNALSSAVSAKADALVVENVSERMDTLDKVLNTKVDKEFIASCGAQSDWDQNNDTSLDYIRNRPFGYMEDVLTEVHPETTVNIEEDGGIADITHFYIFAGITYVVTFDSIKYRIDPGYNTLGNITGYPFRIYTHYNGNTDIYTATITCTTAGPHTFSVHRVVRQEPIKVPDAYLPDTALVQSNWAQSDETAADYIKNKPGGYKNKIENKILDEGDLTFYYSSDNDGYYFVDVPYLGQCLSCRVIIDGDEYELESNGDGMTYGNKSIVDSGYEDTGIPLFLNNMPPIDNLDNGRCTLFTNFSGESHTVEIYSTLEEIIKIPDEYLPNDKLSVKGGTMTGDFHLNWDSNLIFDGRNSAYDVPNMAEISYEKAPTLIEFSSDSSMTSYNEYRLRLGTVDEVGSTLNYIWAEVPIFAGHNPIHGVAAPTYGYDAANKEYVDAAINSAITDAIGNITNGSY